MSHSMLAHILYHFLTSYVCFLRSIFCLFFSTLFSRLHFARPLSGNSSLPTFYFVFPKLYDSPCLVFYASYSFIFYASQASCFILHYARYITHFRLAAISITFLISHFIFLLPSFYLQLLFHPFPYLCQL